jgi:hypothetical protein
MAKNNFQHTMELIQAEAEKLYKLTRQLEIGLPSWIISVGESMRRLTQYRLVQEQGSGFRAPQMTREEKRYRGVYEKFLVTRADGRDGPGEKHCGCDYFVLDPKHDPFALPAMLLYADKCESDYPRLARDLRLWVQGATALQGGR